MGEEEKNEKGAQYEYIHEHYREKQVLYCGSEESTHFVHVAEAPNFPINKGSGQDPSKCVKLAFLTHTAPLQAHQSAGG